MHIEAFHHPMDFAKHIDDKNLLKGRNNAISFFDRHHVDIILSGHIHDPYVNLSNGRYPHIQRNKIISVAGTCLSSRTRTGAPNSFNLIEIDTDSFPKINLIRFDMDLEFQFNKKEVFYFKRDSKLSWNCDSHSREQQ